MGNKRKRYGCSNSKVLKKITNARIVKRQKKCQADETSSKFDELAENDSIVQDATSVSTNSDLNDGSNETQSSNEELNADGKLDIDTTSGSINADPNDGTQKYCDLKKNSTKDIFSLLIKNLETESNEMKSSEEELNTACELEISVLSNASNNPPFLVEGRRIVDFDYFFNQMKTLSEHNPGFGCTISNLQVIKEKRFGLESIFSFQCNMCNQKFKINSCEKLSDNVTVSHAAVTGAMLIGCGRTNLNELLTAMDLPKLEQRIYNECHTDVSNWWAVAAEASMKEAAKEEAQLAIESGDTINGIPAITVVADACWSKRSYRTNYAAASGAAAIIGFKTGKVLHMEVKNKYCIVCARSVAKSRSPPTHQCTKNHAGSSTSMEQISIVEGFKSSVTTHNLIYATLIADGDASTYKKILESRPYPNVQVQKIECSNHLLRNYCSKLMQLQKDTSIPLSERKLLTSDKITRFRTAIRSAARFRKAQETSSSDKIIKLKDDILNSPKHILGDHSACENYYCTDERKKEQNLVPLAKTLFKKIMVCTTQIALNSKSLLYDVNNNRAEQFNSIVAKHVGGKRINFSLKNSYTARCQAAVVAFNTGKAQYSLYKTNFQRSPRKSIKRLELKRCQKNLKRNLRPAGPKKRIIFHDKNDYGERCQKPDLTAEQYETARNVFLENLKVLVEKRHDVERDTILQAESALWLELRRSLLTASTFSKVCKRRSNISSAPLVKSLVYTYSLNNVPAIEYGKSNEKTAILQLQQQEGVSVQKCGIFIDEDFFFLGASPDGLYEDGIVEIKCPYSAKDMDAEQAIAEKKINFWKIDGSVNTNHDWYYQIQGQLHISKKNICLFAVWTGQQFRLKTERISRDEAFWESKMKTRLLDFYEKCLLPEMVDPRKSRSMPIRDTRF